MKEEEAVISIDTLVPTHALVGRRNGTAYSLFFASLPKDRTILAPTHHGCVI